MVLILKNHQTGSLQAENKVNNRLLTFTIKCFQQETNKTKKLMNVQDLLEFQNY